jgi:putative copper resistance protein D
LKLALTIILFAIGARHRKFIQRRDFKSVVPLLLNELVIMVVVLSLGAWLSTLQPPVDPKLANLQDNRQLITGVALPPPPHWINVLTTFNLDGAFFGLLLLFAALYLRGLWQLRRRNDKWPIGRTLAFCFGEIAAFFATSGGLGVYSRYSFAEHMMAHMFLGMIAPIGFVLSAPLTLALRALPSSEADHSIRNLIVGALHSRVMKFYVNPVVALAIFDGSLFVLYMTPLFGNLMNSHNGHLVMDLHFLLAGYLFFYVIIGVDPSPRKIPHIVRIILLFAAMSIHALFSIALLSTSSLIDGGYYQMLDVPWNTDLLGAQHVGGAIGWAMGEVPILIALVATFIQWMRDDRRETKRIDRAAARAAAMGEDDELAQYNKYLSALARSDADQNQLDQREQER